VSIANKILLVSLAGLTGFGAIGGLQKWDALHWAEITGIQLEEA
jgi:hypothetical protein